MNKNPTADRAQPTHHLRSARALLARELGADTLARLQQANTAIDMLSIFGSIALFFLLAGVLAAGSAGSAMWWAALVLQGDLILVMSIVNHDVFVHRKLLPEKLRWVLSQVLAWPAQLKGSTFESKHLTHHRELATAGDPEFYQRGLGTALRRILYATPVMLVFRVLIYRELEIPARPAHGGGERLRVEKRTRLALWAIALGSLAFDWRLLVIGYLLPLALVTPLVNTLRIVLEHFDVGRANPLWPGTFYRTGFITRPTLLWSAGDCHVVHHFYPGIPYYRMPQALRLIAPILRREGVHEHRSLVRLMADWFSGARAHWTEPEIAREKAHALP